LRKTNVRLRDRKVGIEPVSRGIRTWRHNEIGSTPVVRLIVDIAVATEAARKGLDETCTQRSDSTAVLPGLLIGDLLTTDIGSRGSLGGIEGIGIE
jgi:hypothetical protein